MAGITISGSIRTGSAIATAEEIRAAFTAHKKEFTWLAEFLAGDDLLASACITDVGSLTEDLNEDEIRHDCVQLWARDATIRSVLDLKRMRIAELSSTYDHGGLFAQEHPPMSLDTIEFVVRESDIVRSRLDSLCRFVLILCGFEQRSPAEAALLLGISKLAVRAAYSGALELLEIIYWQTVLEAYGCAAA